MLASWTAPEGEGLKNELRAGNTLRYTGGRAGVRGVAELSQRVHVQPQGGGGLERRRLPSGATQRKKWEGIASLPSEMLAWAEKRESGTPSPNSPGSTSAARTFS